MSTIEVSRLLRLALRLDALLSSAAGVLSLAGASLLHPLLGMGSGVVLGLGAFMLGYGLLVGWLGSQRQLPAALAWSIVAGNLLWVLGSIALAVSGRITPTSLGLTLLLGQAAAIAVVTDLQYLGLRRSTPAWVGA
jgi:hypothetical protein